MLAEDYYICFESLYLDKNIFIISAPNWKMIILIYQGVSAIASICSQDAVARHVLLVYFQIFLWNSEHG